MPQIQPKLVENTLKNKRRNHQKTYIVLGICITVGMLITTWLATGLFDTGKDTKHQDKKQLTDNPSTKNPTTTTPQFLFPGNKRTLANNYRFIALYGVPDAPVLGALGQQSLNETISRAKGLAESYQPYFSETSYPTLEIIATIASSEPTDNGDYSREVSIEKLKPWIEQAKNEGVYVLLDLQPGRTDFTTQAKQYEELLKQPHVGLALDPEWRLKPDQVHMKQIGSVSAEEVNQTSKWLADMTNHYKLPQKIFLIHQFKRKMLLDRQNIDTSRTNELVYMIQMDGQGAQNVKNDTWQVITNDLPKNMVMGWKNFTVKDTPMLSPAETMKINPQPWYVSYQ